MKKCLIIDSYGFIFRAFHVQKGLTSPDGEPVGAIFGFTSMLIKLLHEIKPTHVLAVFDTGGKNFRHEIYSSYKSHRPPVPEELIKQFPISREVTKAMNVRIAEAHGFEADDVIATVAERISKNEEVIVVSSDKDLAQLMNDKIKIYDPVKSKMLAEDDIIEKFGVNSNRIRDVLALIGDKSDNIPGVPGFGAKTASELINKFGSFENLCNSYEEIDSIKKRELFRENIDKAKLSYELVGLRKDVNIKLDLEDIVWNKPDHSKLLDFLAKYGFKSLIQRAQKLSDRIKDDNSQQMSFHSLNTSQDTIDYEASDDFKLAAKIARANGYISILESDSRILASAAGRVFSFNSISEISELFEDETVRKIFYNSKNILKIYPKICAYDDISILAYILSPTNPQYDLSGLISKFCKINSYDPIQLTSSMKTLCGHLYKALFDNKLLSLYLDIDLPLSSILAEIENNGVKFDISKLSSLSEEFTLTLMDLESRIFKLSGREFNIGSPKQLGEILFEDLKLPTGSKTGKTKAYSTGAEVLEELSYKGFEIADHLLKWRQISKLKSTYTDSLQKQVNPSTHRVHTTLLQTSTTTGRLSSLEPNLQNIPIRSREGERIRNTIVAEKGNKLVSADYSQVELRILAEIADIKELKDAFHHGVDIHTKTASQVFGVKVENVTNELRRKAKAINFGIIYGISGFGLAKQLGITRVEAKDYIDKYFLAYPGIKNYMEQTKHYAHRNGYVQNFLHRRCYLPLINSSNGAEKSFAERAAINAPIQGAASDIVKLAMIKINKILVEKHLKTKMILQVHDELLFEVPEEEIERLVPLIKKTMENVVNFSIKLRVDVEVSDHWS